MPPEDFLKTLDKREAQTNDKNEHQQDRMLQAQNAQAIVDTISSTIKELIRFQIQHQPKVSVTNQKLPESIKTPDIQKVVDALENLKQPIQDNKLDDTKIIQGLKELGSAIDKLPKNFPDIPQIPEEVTVKNQPDYTKQFDSLGKAIKSIDIKPVVNVPTEEPVDYRPITDSLDNVLNAVKAIKIPKVPVTDLTPLIDATSQVQDAIQALRFPVANYILPFKDSTGKDTQVKLDSSGNLPVSTTPTTNVGIDPIGQYGVAYDSVIYTNTSGTVDTYVYKSGGTGGTTTATVTITYTDTTKTQVSTVVRT